MKILACLLALSPLLVQDDRATFEDAVTSLRFSYPKEWQYSRTKKGESTFLIPIENTSERAVLTVTPARFRSEAEVWQLSQVGFNKALKREVERQWEEEVLGVPVLLTKATYTERGSTKVTVTGLFYTLGYDKLLYRLTASPAEFEKVDYQWRQVMQTLRTVDGSMPMKEDQNVQLPPPPGKDDVSHPTIPRQISGPPKVKAVLAPEAGTVEMNGTKVHLHVPAGWSVSAAGDRAFTLTNPNVPNPVTVTLASQLESDAPPTALLKASAASLNDFTKVDKRDESHPRVNRAAATVVQVWRTGTGANGALATFEAFAQTGDTYALVATRVSDAGRFAGARKALDGLMQELSVSTGP